QNTVISSKGAENTPSGLQAERMRLTRIEGNLRQLIQTLLFLADLNLPNKVIGRLLVDAVQSACGLKLSLLTSEITQGHVAPLTMLTSLLTASPTQLADISTPALLHLLLQGLTQTDSRVSN
ncbi:unnamed protein product, partial [Meganyctiphanes norvegica]